jgi:hypothetical protein
MVCVFAIAYGVSAAEQDAGWRPLFDYRNIKIRPLRRKTEP